MKTLSVLIDCECSGVVREAFNAYSGVCAVLCDLRPPADGRVDSHIQADALEVLKSRHWDAVIAHPPCTRMALSGALRDGRTGMPRFDYPCECGRDPIKFLHDECVRKTSLPNTEMSHMAASPNHEK